MSDTAEILAEQFTLGMVVRGYDKGEWIQLADEPGYVRKSRSLVKVDKWLVGPAVGANVFASTKPDSKVIGTKPIGTIVRGYNFKGRVKLADEPGFFFLSCAEGDDNLIKMTWESFADGLVDSETVEVELLYDMFEAHEDEIARTTSSTDSLTCGSDMQAGLIC
jgi:hypothetical protein